MRAAEHLIVRVEAEKYFDLLLNIHKKKHYWVEKAGTFCTFSSEFRICIISSCLTGLKKPSFFVFFSLAGLVPLPNRIFFQSWHLQCTFSVFSTESSPLCQHWETSAEMAFERNRECRCEWTNGNTAGSSANQSRTQTMCTLAPLQVIRTGVIPVFINSYI